MDCGRASAYRRVLHQLVRRELRTLADVVSWAPDAECLRTGTLTCHAGLVARVLLHHHAVERESVWPALLRGAPPAGWGAADCRTPPAAAPRLTACRPCPEQGRGR